MFITHIYENKPAPTYLQCATSWQTGHTKWKKKNMINNSAIQIDIEEIKIILNGTKT